MPKKYSLFVNIFNQLPVPKHGLIGHRGAAGQAPENTAIGFKKAQQLGLNWVEFDIQYCQSGEWVVFHDETLERTSNGHGFVIQTPLNNLKKLDAGAWFHSSFKHESIPLFAETLKQLAYLNIHPNIEIKPFEAGSVTKKRKMLEVLQIIQTHWPSSHPLPLISSFDLTLLTLLRSLHSTIPLGYLVDKFSEAKLKKVATYRLNSLHCNDSFKDLFQLQRAVEKSKKLCVPLLIYTVNDSHRIKVLIQNGVFSVFSDLTNIDFLHKN